ncbi:hypothetical protein Mapa_005860 [Marchantia paleacea]|nr:hypothetical protein Mapa_005860 [Marchantia paleacea]
MTRNRFTKDLIRQKIAPFGLGESPKIVNFRRPFLAAAGLSKVHFYKLLLSSALVEVGC